MSNDDRLKTTMGATQKSWFRRNRFCRVTPAQFIRYLKSFYKANLDINKPLRLWVIIYTFLKFRTFGATPILTIIFLYNSYNWKIRLGSTHPKSCTSCRINYVFKALKIGSGSKIVIVEKSIWSSQSRFYCKNGII